MKPVNIKVITPHGTVSAIHTRKASMDKAITAAIRCASRAEIACTLLAEIDNLVIILWRAKIPLGQTPTVRLLKFLPPESKNASSDR